MEEDNHTNNDLILAPPSLGKKKISMQIVTEEEEDNFESREGTMVEPSQDEESSNNLST